MTTTTSLEITTTRDSVEKNRTVSYINPEAEAADLVDFAEAYVGLTKDNYSKTTRIDKTDCDTAPVRTNYPITKIDYVKTINGSQTFPQIDLSNPVISMDTDNFTSSKTFMIRITTSYISAPFITCTSSNWNFAGSVYALHSSMGAQTNAWTIRLYTEQETIAAENSTITLHFDGNQQYKPFDINIAFNITEPQP